MAKQNKRNAAGQSAEQRKQAAEQQAGSDSSSQWTDKKLDGPNRPSV